MYPSQDAAVLPHLSDNVTGIPDVSVPLGLAQDLLLHNNNSEGASLVPEDMWCGKPQILSKPHPCGNPALCEVAPPPKEYIREIANSIMKSHFAQC